MLPSSFFSSACGDESRIQAISFMTPTNQATGSVFHPHLVPLWPLSSCCPLERDTHSNGLITRGVHFEEVLRDEMKGLGETVGGKWM